MVENPIVVKEIFRRQRTYTNLALCMVLDWSSLDFTSSTDLGTDHNSRDPVLSGHPPAIADINQ